MISFSCSQCRQPLTVKDDFAGRTARCPGCKQPLTVPAASTDETVQVGRPSAAVGVEPGAALPQRSANGERYQIESQIARGGMGSVMRAVDCDLRREVAVKFMLDQADPKKKQRFVEEAQITGQLEHPNIVPIHELGVDSQQRLFFAMKMVRGRSLAEVLNIHHDDPKTAAKDWPLGRLLSIFVNICHALAYAHARGVVHRDLKPANVMVGDFGETYVMDWGLAKVLSVGQASSLPAPGRLEACPTAAPVQTDRGADANLTQEGSIMGTPVYMPPEQAAGQLDAIDQRSDVYSLGAILYEVLTLEPPVDPAGGPMATLMQVLQGQVVPPEQRTPERASRIPRELSAIAMKALAKEPKDRYPDVEALRRDVERFQEGRSVSAKEDTKWELIVKFIRRNKGFSAGAAAALLVLLASMVVLFAAWQETRQAKREAETAYADLEKKQAEKEQLEKDKREQLIRSVPTLVRSARLLADEGDVNEARRQVELALEYQNGNPDALLLKGQLFVAEKKWEAGRDQLAQYLKLRPGDVDAQKLLDLCAKGRKEDTAFLVEVAEVFQKQKLYGVGARLLKDVQATVKEREPLLALYRKQIEKAWPGQAGRLTLEANDHFRLNLGDFEQLAALDPIKGIPLDELHLGGCRRVSDLSPLRGMPLVWLSLNECGGSIRDLGPLEGMPLNWLSLRTCGGVHDLRPLTGMPLRYLSLDHCSLIRTLAPLRRMPLTELRLHGCSEIHDLEPLRGMPLSVFHMAATGPVDVTPLESAKLTDIALPYQVDKGMKVLRRLNTPVHINGLLAEEFWKKYDAGEFPQYKP